MTTLTRAPLPRAALPALGALAVVAALILALAVVALTGAPSAQAEPTNDNIIILEATATLAPPPMVTAYAAPGGAQMGGVPEGLPWSYRDSRNPGWVGADWNGGVVWVQADGDTSALADLAPPPTAQPQPTAPPAPVLVYQEQQPAPQQVAPTAAPSWDQLSDEEKAKVIGQAYTNRDQQWQSGQMEQGCFDASQQAPDGRMAIVTCAPTEAERDRLLAERLAGASAPGNAPQTNAAQHPYVASRDCEWHPPMVMGTCD